MTNATDPDVVARPHVEVWAAGGVISRRGSDGRREVLIVHRPHRLDWSLPKGRVEPGETLAGCAHREVFEETGFRCGLGSRLATVEYRDRRNRAKAVVYWEMTIESGSFQPNDEVDEVAWVELGRTHELLTYERDAALLRDLSDA